MRFSVFGIVALAVAYVPRAWAATTTDSVSAPTCGLTCIVTAIVQNSTCELLDTTCICSNVALNEAAALCIAENCSVRDQLATQRYSKTTCGIEGRDRTRLVWVVGIVFLALGLLAFGLRVMARVCIGPSIAWGADDWVITAAVVCMVPLGVLSVPLAQLGLGKDIWNVDPDNITKILYLYFWDELVYLASLPLTKISILLFYLRIFPKKQIKIAIWVLIGINIAYLIVFEVISIFQCTPLPGAWLAWDGTYAATCRDINLQGWMAAGLNLALDLAVLILPLTELCKLSMTLRKKLQILSMFCVGFFVTIVSLIRLQSLAQYASTTNLTQDYVEIGYWSTIEVPVGVICASMPAIRSLVGRIFPKAFGTTQKNKSDYKGFSDHSSGHVWSKNRVTGQGKHIKVKTEWTMHSHHMQEDTNASEIQLVPITTKVSDEVEASTSLRPTLDLADMTTVCKAGREKRKSESAD